MFAARFFNVRYWAARYWPKIGGTSVVIGPTPDTRKGFVPFESRSVSIAAENRTALVPPDPRTVPTR